MYGWMGQILRVDLATGKIQKEPLDEALAHQYIGGRGFTTRYQYEELDPGVDPMGPENKLIFAPGPACGTLVPGSQRWTVGAKSPMTGLIGDSNCGGLFGAGLKYAGYDMVIVQGKSDTPLYLLIDGDDIRLQDATHLRGKTTGETARTIKQNVGDPNICVACIGIAGDNLVKFATIQDDTRTAGRSGMGAVMGSKKLKAIAVKGVRGVRVANTQEVENKAREIFLNWRKNMPGIRRYHEYGPGVGTPILYNRLGIIATHNFRQGRFDAYASSIADRLREDLWLKPKSCFSCPVACDHHYIVSQGRFAGIFGGGLEGPGMWYSSQIGSADPELMCKLTTLSDQYGVDEAEIAGILGWLMECAQLGILTANDLDGIEIQWGDSEAILKVTEMIVHRRGIGDVLAEGAKKASETLGKGSENYVMHVKGMAIDERDPRGSKSFALGYAVGSRGAEHCRHAVPEFLVERWEKIPWMKKEFNWLTERGRMAEAGKGRLHKWFEDVRTFQHALEICIFAFESSEVEWTRLLAEIYSAVTGVDFSAGEVLTAGERIITLERLFNIREGLTRKDDNLPDRFLKEPLPDGASKGQVVDLDLMIDEYYEARGWDKVTGFPSRQKLKQLELGDISTE